LCLPVCCPTSSIALAGHQRGIRQTQRPQDTCTQCVLLCACLQVLAALSGGRLALHAQPVAKRWTRLAVPAAAGDSSITVIGDAVALEGWGPGREVLVTSSTFNPEQAETRRIVAVAGASSGQLQLTLDSPLLWNHGGGQYRYRTVQLSSSTLCVLSESPGLA